MTGMTPLCELKTNTLAQQGYYKVGYVLMNADASNVCLSAQGAVAWLTRDQFWWVMHERDHVEFEWPKPISPTPLPSVPVALEARRGLYGWTQAKMAAALGLRSSHYSEIIHGARGLPLNATRLAYAIGVPAAVLLAPLPPPKEPQ